MKKKTYQEIRQEWQTRLQLFEKEYRHTIKKIIVVYECEWRKQREEDRSIKTFLSGIYRKPPNTQFQISSAYTGGRAEVNKFVRGFMTNLQSTLGILHVLG